MNKKQRLTGEVPAKSVAVVPEPVQGCGHPISAIVGDEREGTMYCSMCAQNSLQEMEQ